MLGDELKLRVAFGDVDPTEVEVQRVDRGHHCTIAFLVSAMLVRLEHLTA
jgi:hypothetical protein